LREKFMALVQTIRAARELHNALLDQLNLPLLPCVHD